MNLLEIKNLTTQFETTKGIIKVVDDVSFSIKPGKTLAVVGSSGSGKSQTALAILKLFKQNQKIVNGTITFDGQLISEYNEKEISKIRGNQISIIFQEPMSSLNPVLKIKRQLIEVLLTHQKISKKEALAKVLQVLNDVKINNPTEILKMYPHQLSGGMCQRIAIAMGLLCKPKLLIADEATTALDVIVQAQILRLMNQLKDDYNTAILFITHDLAIACQMADEIIVMYKSKVCERIKADMLFKGAVHPYTKELLNAFYQTDAFSSSEEISDLYSAENESFDFDKFRRNRTVDDDYIMITKDHYVAVNLKNKEKIDGKK